MAPSDATASDHRQPTDLVMSEQLDVVDAQVPPADVSTEDLAPIDVATPDVSLDAGCGDVWPSCEARPAAAVSTTLAALWTENPARPSFRWVSGAVVTAVSRGGCVAGSACQIFVQEPGAATTLDEVAHRAIKVFVSSAAAGRFATVRVGDRVDLAAHAWRYDVGGQNELLLQIADSCSLRGCMQRTGSGTVTAVRATLASLASVMAYETTYGPVLVRFEGVSATTDMSSPLDSTTGGLFTTGATPDAGFSGVPISVSPFFLPAGRFTGFSGAQRIRFTSLTGVFGMFIPSTPGPDGGVRRLLQVYPRTVDDLVISTM
jgi:hypothetical protein